MSETEYNRVQTSVGTDRAICWNVQALLPGGVDSSSLPDGEDQGILVVLDSYAQIPLRQTRLVH